MALKETRRTLVDASNKGDYAAVVAIVDKAPALVDMSDLDVAWRTAEARGRTGQDDKALEINKAILASTQDPAARLATVQKAMAVLKPDELKSLLALGKTGPDGQSEFDAVETDLVRQQDRTHPVRRRRPTTCRRPRSSASRPPPSCPEPASRTPPFSAG